MKLNVLNKDEDYVILLRYFFCETFVVHLKRFWQWSGDGGLIPDYMPTKDRSENETEKMCRDDNACLSTFTCIITGEMYFNSKLTI